MTRLLVRNIPDVLAKKLKRRAAANGVSAEEEHRRILHAALSAPAAKKKSRTLFDAFRELGKIAPDFDFARDRKRSRSRPLDL